MTQVAYLCPICKRYSWTKINEDPEIYKCDKCGLEKEVPEIIQASKRLAEKGMLNEKTFKAALTHRPQQC